MKIQLPLLERLEIRDSENLRCFDRLNSLKKIIIGWLDEIDDIDSIFDPTKIISLNIKRVGSTSHTFLSLFTNLRELKIMDSCEMFDLESHLPKMKALTTLSLCFRSSCTANYLGGIYNNCRQLHTFEISLRIAFDYVDYFEEMIESMKSNLIKRSTPLTLIIQISIGI